MTRFRRAKLLSCWLLASVLALLWMVQPAQAQSSFARIAHDDDGRPRALQLAIISYEIPHGRAGGRVDLVGAVHIADEAYYASLNEHFRDYDAVLYELVAPQGTVITPDVELTGFISGSQRMLTQMLDLSFQLREIDYTQPTFVHADLSPDEMSASMAARNESLYTYFWRIISAAIRDYGRDPLGLRGAMQMESALSSGGNISFKVLMAYQLADVERMRHVLGNDADTAVVGARNERAIEVMHEQLSGGARRVGIFYGVAHMPDFEDRLVALGYVPVETKWVDAWLLSSAASE